MSKLDSLRKLVQREQEQAQKRMEQKEPAQRGGWQVTRLNARHEFILRLVLAGHSQKHIAEVVGMSRSHVCKIINSPVFQRERLAWEEKIAALRRKKMEKDGNKQ